MRIGVPVVVVDMRGDWTFHAWQVRPLKVVAIDPVYWLEVATLAFRRTSSLWGFHTDVCKSPPQVNLHTIAASPGAVGWMARERRADHH